MQTEGEHPLSARVRAFGNNLHRIGLSYERRILTVLFLAFVAAIVIIGAWKLWSFGYNALDLAIYRQVAANSLRGQLFSFTLHPHSYLGDHLELFFAALFPIYAAFRFPLTLIVLQAFALAIAVFPLARIAQRFVGKPWHLLIAGAYLANPVIQNMALYEFHLLPFAIPILSFALLAYLEQRYRRFLVLILLALIVREDVALIVIGLGILGLFDRRSRKWSIAPILLGSIWFIVALKLTAYFSGYAEYKYLVYYHWLGSNIPDMIRTIVLRPWIVLQHLVTPGNLGFLVGLFLPFAYLPVLRPWLLLPALPVFLQLMLAQSAGELLLSIHYPSLVLPFMAAATASSIRSILNPPRRGIFHWFAKERAMTLIIFCIVIIYGMLVIGPFAQSVPVLAQSSRIADRIALERDMIHMLANGTTIAGYEALTSLSNRPRLYSMHYVFLGKKQFSDQNFVIPDDASVVLLDLRDFLLYQLLYQAQDADNRNGYRRIRNLLSDRGFVVTAYVDRFAILEKRAASDLNQLYTTTEPGVLRGTPSVHDSISFVGWSTPGNALMTTNMRVNQRAYTVLPFSLTFEKTRNDSSILQLEIELMRSATTQYRAVLPFGAGMYPTSDWTINEPVTSNYRVLIPKYITAQPLELRVRVVRVDGRVLLNGVRSLAPQYSTYEYVGSSISLGSVQIQRTTR